MGRQGGDNARSPPASNYAPLTVHAALRANGDLCLLVINKSPSAALTARIALSNFVPAASTATVYQFGETEDTNNADLATSTLAGVSENFSATFPAYSMTVIDLAGSPPAAIAHPSFFAGETALTNGVYYLSFASGNPFGYYGYLTDPRYLYHFDLGYEYWFDAADGKDGIYFYDFASKGFFYTSPTFPFPYLYDFSLNSVVYYYPDPNNAGRYNTDGVRYFYVFSTGQIISK